ncbi:recombinase family protein, partial [Clostridium fessum]|uniref:recombinase family protein n=1 Tax=Clostridium fessum TaxID=2126740 RepID=UPI0029438259
MNTKQSDKRITALYARLSRDDEKDGISGSIQNQKVILEKYAKDNHLPNPRFFYDDGFSGVTFTRPAFMEIMELAEQGMVGTIVVKDHSRLGRNRLVVGQLLEEDFVRLDVRYIAIMDNIDTEKGISDIVPMQDLFNEWHAKNTSDKVRRVMQSKGMSGKPLTTNPPFGYMKNPENKDEWIVDEPAAKVVKQIFEMCVSGLGPTQIAKQLHSEKVLTPTEYWNSIGRKCSKPPAVPYNWCAATVADILDKQEYCGDTVNFRTTSKSFKLKKRLERPQEDWQIFENTHPAIIDRETFELVQELRKHRRRPNRTGEIS